MDNQVKKRCSVCNKKVGIDYYNCNCDSTKYFCCAHRFPFEHNCSINSLKQNSEKLSKQNIKLIAPKIITI